MKIKVFYKIIIGVLFLISTSVFAIDPPAIEATGEQTYCPGTSLKIVQSVSIVFDSADPKIYSVYIQISSGYDKGQDKLTLNNASLHPSITAIPFDSNTGMLTLTSATGNQVSSTDFEAAIEDVQFSNSSPLASGTKTFSITIGTKLLSYLPRNEHLYEYVPFAGIYWTDAKSAAEKMYYYGLQGYLATLTAADEAQLCGPQGPGAGWIGGSDVDYEGVWKWVTGPEAGITFWLGNENGTTTPPFYYANWNSSFEPNNAAGEHYAHIRPENLPNGGTWNDLPNEGTTGDYYPSGYFVEYGGMPGDPTLKISASTSMTIAETTVSTPAPICGSGTATLEASSTKTINWYEDPIGGTPLETGTSFTTPTLTTDTTYYVDNGCLNRIPITVTVNAIPTITATNTPVSRCSPGIVTITANSTFGIINWYASETGTTIEGIGNSFTIPNIASNATYYAEAFNNGCSNGTRVPVEVLVYTPPIVSDQEVTKCKLLDVELDASLSGMSYLWSTTETTKTITVSTAGTYSVTVTSPAPENCSSTKNIKVIEYDIPEIDRIDVNETTVVVYLKKEELYFEYSIDDVDYQSSNVFFNVQSGLQKAYVREINLCTTNSSPFIVLIAPTFFTPNGDTYNDYWEVKGLLNYPQAEVSIFDRYGKLISVLNATKSSWDGTFNKSPLPPDDYWYELKIDESKPIKQGHFSLKR
jgi:gliding motility-associated-like protein